MTEQPQEPCFVRSNGAPIPNMRRFSHEAMATIFELMIIHEDERYARQAATAAFDEVDRLERELSRFIENSDIARINNLPVNRSLLLGLDAFECLKVSVQMYHETKGAFDITIGSLLKCWRDEEGNPRTPSEKELNFARLHTGGHLIRLDEREHTIQLAASPVLVDLGGIGKGYAVDRVADLLREWSIETALISGGYSSVLALDAPPGTKGWPLTLSDPIDRTRILARPHLRAGALGGSGVKKGGHIISPRTGRPIEGKRAAWSAAPDAGTADALSTAFMVMDTDEIHRYCSLHPDRRAMVMLMEPDEKMQKDKVLHFGSWPEEELVQ
ncbi:MAG: FAD:protein FMN transferase [Sedimentisphaerales bacterium]|nr:FAD:protein FMN transferase [Sedimentisphaerales bacterium]